MKQINTCQKSKCLRHCLQIKHLFPTEGRDTPTNMNNEEAYPFTGKI